MAQTPAVELDSLTRPVALALRDAPAEMREVYLRMHDERVPIWLVAQERGLTTPQVRRAVLEISTSIAVHDMAEWGFRDRVPEWPLQPVDPDVADEIDRVGGALSLLRNLDLGTRLLADGAFYLRTVLAVDAWLMADSFRDIMRCVADAPPAPADPDMEFTFEEAAQDVQLTNCTPCEDHVPRFAQEFAASDRQTRRDALHQAEAEAWFDEARADRWLEATRNAYRSGALNVWGREFVTWRLCRATAQGRLARDPAFAPLASELRQQRAAFLAASGVGPDEPPMPAALREVQEAHDERINRETAVVARLAGCTDMALALEARPGVYCKSMELVARRRLMEPPAARRAADAGSFDHLTPEDFARLDDVEYDIDAVEEEDPEIALVADFLGGDLDEEAADAVRRSIREDDAFFSRNWLMLTMWEQSHAGTGPNSDTVWAGESQLPTTEDQLRHTFIVTFQQFKHLLAANQGIPPFVLKMREELALLGGRRPRA